jgi:hypothetical protein
MESDEITSEYFERRSEHFLRYFGCLVEAHNPPWDEWLKGYELAVEWQRMLRLDNPPLQEIDALVDRAQNEHEGGSGMIDLWMHVNHWRRWLKETGRL